MPKKIYMLKKGGINIPDHSNLPGTKRVEALTKGTKVKTFCCKYKKIKGILVLQILTKVESVNLVRLANVHRGNTNSGVMIQRQTQTVVLVIGIIFPKMEEMIVNM